MLYPSQTFYSPAQRAALQLENVTAKLRTQFSANPVFLSFFRPLQYSECLSKPDRILFLRHPPISVSQQIRTS